MERIEFPSILRESILDGLRHILGESPLKAVLFHLGPVQLEDPREFHIRLSSIFGEGTRILEKETVKELFRRLNLSFEEQPGFDFESCVERGKEAFERKAKLT